MAPENTTILHIAVPKVHSYHTCPSAATYRGRVTANTFGLAAGLLHSNAKLLQIVI